MNRSPADKSVVYTVGHSNHEWPAFAALLGQHGITVVADVRSSPYSGYTPWFNREQIQAALRAEGIRYLFLGDVLGAKRTEPECIENDKVRFDRVARLPSFIEGLARLRRGMAEHRVALMCAEKDPITCHRTILVCRHLRNETTAIRHILEDGRIETQAEAEDRLLTLLKMPPGDLFDGKETLVEEAYDRQGERIAVAAALSPDDIGETPHA